MRIRPIGERDAGTTLVEMLVSVLLLGVIGAIVLAATVSVNKSQRVADDETRGQEDVAVVVDRLSRDIRDARGVVCDGAAGDTACTTHLQLWIDYDSNYKQDTNETITWKLRPSGDGVHYDMVRIIGTSTQVVARTIVENVAFKYTRGDNVYIVPSATQPAPGEPTTRVVEVKMTYDAISGSATGRRSVVFTSLLRNVP